MAGIAYQQATERYYLPLMILYGLMVGVPGLAQLVLALRGLADLTTDSADTSSTESSPAPPRPSESSTSSS